MDRPHSRPACRLRRLSRTGSLRTVGVRQPRGGSRALCDTPVRCCGTPRAPRRERSAYGRQSVSMSTAQDDALVVALARATVERAAPEELVIFPAASEAYLQGQDPSKATRGDPMLGFGVDAAVVLLAPVALTVAKEVLGFLRVQLKKHAEERGDDAVDWLIQPAVQPEGRGALRHRSRRRGGFRPRAGGCKCGSRASRRHRADRRRARAGARPRAREGEAAQAARREGAASRRLARRQPRHRVTLADPEAQGHRTPEPLRFPVRHDVPLRSAGRRRARRESLRLELALDRRRLGHARGRVGIPRLHQ